MKGFTVTCCLFAHLMLSGCQSYEEGIAKLCESPNHADLSATSFAERMVSLSRWLDDNVSNAQARRVVASVADMPRAESIKSLRKIAADANMEACPLADQQQAGMEDELKGVCEHYLELRAKEPPEGPALANNPLGKNAADCLEKSLAYAATHPKQDIAYFRCVESATSVDEAHECEHIDSGL